MASSRHRKTLLLGAAVFAFAAAGVASAADLDKGQELFHQCAQCHGARGEGNQANLAPSIAGMDAWYVKSQLENFQAGTRGKHPDDMGGLRMYPISLSLKSDYGGTDAEKIEAVSAYVESLPEVVPIQRVEGGDAEKGAVFYATCKQCHGAEGQGNQQMNSPPLAGTSDWYLVTELEQYKQGIRGGNPANTNAVLMRGMSNMLPDDQAIRDVVAYIVTLQPSKQEGN